MNTKQRRELIKKRWKLSSGKKITKMIQKHWKLSGKIKTDDFEKQMDILNDIVE